MSAGDTKAKGLMAVNDTPSKIIGHVDLLTRSQIAGWAADVANPQSSVLVDVLADGNLVARGRAHQSRPDLRSQFDGATGNYGFRFPIDPSLSMWRSHAITVTVQGVILPGGQALLDGVPPSDDRPIPIMVTTTGRAGSSLLMSYLARHPEIVVGGGHPFEVKLLIYYALSLMLHISEGDREKSLDPNKMGVETNRYQIGRNPFNDLQLSRHPAIVDYWRTGLPSILRDAFRRAIVEYYDAWRMSLDRTRFTYFAEKMHPQQELRRATHFLFPRVRELLLIRDPRDLLCSYNQFFGASFAQGIQLISDQLRQIKEIKAEGSALVVRYEDLVRDDDATIRDICNFLGLEHSLLAPQEDTNRIFRSHATSRSANDSIGRWQKDLDDDVKTHIRQWDEFLVEFNY